MSKVRDEAIVDWDSILDGRMKDQGSQLIREEFLRLDERAAAFVRAVLPKIVDTTLHHLLWTLEQEDDVHVAVDVEGAREDIREASDGLAGDMYDWLPRFSKQRFEQP